MESRSMDQVVEYIGLAESHHGIVDLGHLVSKLPEVLSGWDGLCQFSRGNGFRKILDNE